MRHAGYFFEALQLGAMKLGRVAIDGSKVKANASKHKAMSYRRMQEDDRLGPLEQPAHLLPHVFRVLAAANEPDIRTLSDFRKIHLVALEGLFQQVLRMDR